MIEEKSPQKIKSHPVHLQLLLLYTQFFLKLCGVLLYTLYILVKFVYTQFFPAQFKSLEKQIILVTGGANGIGREVCLRLGKLEKNLTIISWDIDEQANEILIKKFKSLRVKNVHGFTVDVSDSKQIELTAETIRQQIGNVTMLVNNAGISGPIKNGWDVPPKVVEKVYQVNALSHACTLRECLPSMIEKGHGHVIETCSVFGFFYAKLGASYIASKHAMKGYIELIKEDLRNLKEKPDVKFTLVYPHHTLTNLSASANVKAGKYPFLIPHMTPSFVASKMVEGVLRNCEHIYVPGEMRIFSIILQILPPQAVRKLIDIVDMQMDISN